MRSAIRYCQLRAIPLRRTSRPTLLAPRMRTPLGPSRTSWSLHRNEPTLWRSVGHSKTHPIDLCADRLLTVTCSFRTMPLTLHLRAEGLRFVLLVRAERARARERLPSYREFTSRNPRTESATTKCLFRFRLSAHRFAFSHSFPRQAGFRASFRLAPWVPPRRLATSR